jgi:hypothetical protein
MSFKLRIQTLQFDGRPFFLSALAAETPSPLGERVGVRGPFFWLRKKKKAPSPGISMT